MSLGLIILGFVPAGLLFYTFLVETRWPKYEQLRIPVPKPMPPGGISVLHLSDIHFKKWNPGKIRLFRSLGKKTYDLILITGDIIDDFHGNKTALRALQYLRARHGIYCVLGNHEYLYYRAYHWLGVLLRRKLPIRKNPLLKEFKDGLNKLGVQHLGNRNTHLAQLGITLIGVDDFSAGMSRMERATQHLSRQTFNILMAHHPDSLLAAKAVWFDLALCGHTHGGQIRLPFVGALFTDSKLPKHLAMGRVKINGIDTYISRGLGTSRFMVPRLLCRPEITEMILVPQGALLEGHPAHQSHKPRESALSLA